MQTAWAQECVVKLTFKLKKKKKNLCLFADFHGTNSPTMVDLSSRYGIVEHRVGKAWAWPALRSQQKQPPAPPAQVEA